MPVTELSASRLSLLLHEVLTDSIYRDNAQRFRKSSPDITDQLLPVTCWKKLSALPAEPVDQSNQLPSPLNIRRSNDEVSASEQPTGFFSRLIARPGPPHKHAGRAKR